MSLGQAIALSVACHLILVWLAAWIRLGSPSDARAEVRPEPRPDRIEISFVAPAEEPEVVPGAGGPDASDPIPHVPPPEPASGPPAILQEPPAGQPGPQGEPEPSPRPVNSGSMPEVGEQDPVPGPARSPVGEGRRTPSLRRALREFQNPGPIEPGDPQAAGGGQGRNVFVPDLSQVPQTGLGVGPLVFESRDFDWNDYARQIYWEILKAWYRRLWATTDEFEKWGLQTSTWFLDHQTRVRFVIESSGQVVAVEQEAGSGCPPLDRSAIEALEEVILPPLPKGFPRERETVHARFVAIGDLRAMRGSLEAYRGWF